MNTRYSRTLTLASATALAALLAAGCGTTSGYKQADKTGAGIAEFRTEIVNGKQAIDTTMKALDAVAVSANTNPRKAYEQFSKSLANLESVAAKARKRGEEMKAQGQAYFAQWEKQLAEVQNAEIRTLAAQQKAKLQATFDSIRKYTEPLKAQFDPWMSDLKDLDKYLGTDLSVSGVDAAKSLFRKTQSEGLEVQKSMDALVAELNTVAATLTPATGKPQAK
jgi:hypothetical protein